MLTLAGGNLLRILSGSLIRKHFNLQFYLIFVLPLSLKTEIFQATLEEFGTVADMLDGGD